MSTFSPAHRKAAPSQLPTRYGVKIDRVDCRNIGTGALNPRTLFCLLTQPPLAEGAWATASMLFATVIPLIKQHFHPGPGGRACGILRKWPASKQRHSVTDEALLLESCSGGLDKTPICFSLSLSLSPPPLEQIRRRRPRRESSFQAHPLLSTFQPLAKCHHHRHRHYCSGARAQPVCAPRPRARTMHQHPTPHSPELAARLRPTSAAPRASNANE